MAAALNNANKITIYVKNMIGGIEEITINRTKSEDEIKKALHQIDPDAYPIESIELMQIPANNSNVSRLMNKLQDLFMQVAAAEEQKVNEKEKKAKKAEYYKEQTKLKKKLKVDVSALEDGDMISVTVKPSTEKSESLVTLVDCDRARSLWFHFQVDRAKGMKIIDAVNVEKQPYSPEEIKQLIDAYPKQDVYLKYDQISKVHEISNVDPGSYPEKRIDQAIRFVSRYNNNKETYKKYFKGMFRYRYAPQFGERDGDLYILTDQERIDLLSPIGREQNLMEIVIQLDTKAVDEIIQMVQESECTPHTAIIHKEKKKKVSKGGATHRRRSMCYKKKTRKLSKK